MMIIMNLCVSSNALKVGGSLLLPNKIEYSASRNQGSVLISEK